MQQLEGDIVHEFETQKILNDKKEQEYMKKIENEMLKVKQSAVVKYGILFEKELAGTFLNETNLKSAHSRMKNESINLVMN